MKYNAGEHGVVSAYKHATCCRLPKALAAKRRSMMMTMAKSSKMAGSGSSSSSSSSGSGEGVSGSGDGDGGDDTDDGSYFHESTLSEVFGFLDLPLDGQALLKRELSSLKTPSHLVAIDPEHPAFLGNQALERIKAPHTVALNLLP